MPRSNICIALPILSNIVISDIHCHNPSYPTEAYFNFPPNWLDIHHNFVNSFVKSYDSFSPFFLSFLIFSHFSRILNSPFSHQEPFSFEPFFCSTYGDCGGLMTHYDPNDEGDSTNAGAMYINAEWYLSKIHILGMECISHLLSHICQQFNLFLHLIFKLCILRLSMNNFDTFVLYCYDYYNQYLLLDFVFVFVFVFVLIFIFVLFLH